MIEQNETNGTRARPELLQRGADSGQAWHLHGVMTIYGAVARHPREGSPAFTCGKDLKAVDVSRHDRARSPRRPHRLAKDGNRVSRNKANIG